MGLLEWRDIMLKYWPKVCSLSFIRKKRKIEAKGNDLTPRRRIFSGEPAPYNNVRERGAWR